MISGRTKAAFCSMRLRATSGPSRGCTFELCLVEPGFGCELRSIESCLAIEAGIDEARALGGSEVLISRSGLREACTVESGFSSEMGIFEFRPAAKFGICEAGILSELNVPETSLLAKPGALEPGRAAEPRAVEAGRTFEMRPCEGGVRVELRTVEPCAVAEPGAGEVTRATESYPCKVGASGEARLLKPDRAKCGGVSAPRYCTENPVEQPGVDVCAGCFRDLHRAAAAARSGSAGPGQCVRDSMQTPQRVYQYKACRYLDRGARRSARMGQMLRLPGRSQPWRPISSSDNERG
jgi:hypothetical protein